MAADDLKHQLGVGHSHRPLQVRIRQVIKAEQKFGKAERSLLGQVSRQVETGIFQG
jgi:hypothetical protein